MWRCWLKDTKFGQLRDKIVAKGKELEKGTIIQSRCDQKTKDHLETANNLGGKEAEAKIEGVEVEGGIT